jgi:hypothetical protein
MSDRATRLTGFYALIAAGAALLLSPLLALSYFETNEGADEPETGMVSAWADPARDLVGGLLTWASPERVYATYFLLFWVLFPAVFLCARAVRARRPAARGRLERLGWRMALFGYGFGIVGLIVASMILVTGSSAGNTIDVVFLALMVPAMAIDVVGSTVLGIALLRDGYEPKLSAWLLALVLPSMLVVPGVLGNLSLGLLPVFVAWAAAGLQLWREGPTGAAQRSGTGGLRVEEGLETSR